MNKAEIPQPEGFTSQNEFPSPVEIIKFTEIRTVFIDRLKRKPILLSQVLQTVHDITTTGIILSGSASEIFREDYHSFHLYFTAPYSNEDICRLAYASDDKRGLSIEAFSGRSFCGEYYQTQLKAVARSRGINFIETEDAVNAMLKVKGIPPGKIKQIEE